MLALGALVSPLEGAAFEKKFNLTIENIIRGPNLVGTGVHFVDTVRLVDIRWKIMD
ncbi:MAG TPA: hypothetical protein VK604_22420 [Bryobacteraceae bacterium]|nr:hypothetical protein [Bryobacteraceae bacterium]